MWCESFAFCFFFNDTATTDIYTLSLHDALPICHKAASDVRDEFVSVTEKLMDELAQCYNVPIQDRKSGSAGMPRPISYAVFCLKKKNLARRNVINHHEISELTRMLDVDKHDRRH